MSSQTPHQDLETGRLRRCRSYMVQYKFVVRRVGRPRLPGWRKTEGLKGFQFFVGCDEVKWGVLGRRITLVVGVRPRPFWLRFWCPEVLFLFYDLNPRKDPFLPGMESSCRPQIRPLPFPPETDLPSPDSRLRLFGGTTIPSPPSPSVPRDVHRPGPLTFSCRQCAVSLLRPVV